MMKTHRSSPARMLAGAAAILMLGGVSLAAGSAGLAQPAAQTQTDTQTQSQSGAGAPGEPQRHVERIVIRTDHDEHAGATAGHQGAGATTTERRERVIVMDHHGEGGHGDAHAMAMHHDGDMHEVIIPDCAGGHRDEVNEGTDNNRTRIVLCTRGGEATPAERADRLAHVRDRLASDSDLSAEQKARVLAALDRQIAQLRGH